MKTLFYFISPLFLVSIVSCSTTPAGMETYKPKKALIVEFPEEESPAASERSTGAESLESIEVPVVDYNSPEEIPEVPEDDGLTNDARVYNNTVSATIVPSKEDFKGGAVTYNYADNYLYKLFCVPDKTTDIQLEPGETIVSPPVCGNLDDFIVGNTFAMKNNIKQEIINILPVQPYKNTTLTIYTDRRIYKFEVESFKNTYMPMISFNYPLDTFDKMVKDSAKFNSQVILSGDITKFDFGYNVIPMSIHKPAWMPSLVFTDSTKTYIFFPSAESASYAPVLFEVSGKDRVLKNYRVVGQYYIVDDVLEHAELVLDINNNNIITILRGNE